MRKDCTLSRLTEEQQADLFDWLDANSYTAVQKRIAQPPPKGFGLRVHTNTLFRFYHQRLAQLRDQDLADATQNAGLRTQDFSGGTQDSLVKTPDAFISASRLALSHATWRLAHSPLDSKNVRALASVLQQHDETSLKREFLEVSRQHVAIARERVDLHRREFEYNAARAALALLPFLNEIDRRTDIDDESKIWLACDRLFGSIQNPTSDPVSTGRGQEPPPPLDGSPQFEI